MEGCPVCESHNTIRKGYNHTQSGKKQRYKCLDCKRMFSSHDRLPNNHVTSEIISLCIDLYLKGLSYHVIKQQLREQFRISVSHVTVYNWLKKYTDILKNYTDRFNPELSVVWQMDETVINFKGRSFWCWDCIDTDTRYVVDMFLAPTKDRFDALQFFARMKRTIATEPQVIATDGNGSYIQPIKTFYPDAAHIKIKAISIKPNTSFIERFHGTIKNRTKIMRGFHGFIPCQNWLTLFQIYYNFLRPHMALDGKTPANKAGITLEFPQRWISMIQEAMLLESRDTKNDLSNSNQPQFLGTFC